MDVLLSASALAGLPNRASSRPRLQPSPRPRPRHADRAPPFDGQRDQRGVSAPALTLLSSTLLPRRLLPSRISLVGRRLEPNSPPTSSQDSDSEEILASEGIFEEAIAMDYRLG